MKNKNCIITKHGITCFDEINKINKINNINFDYLISYCLLNICEKFVIYSFNNFKLLNNNLSFIDAISFT